MLLNLFLLLLSLLVLLLFPLLLQLLHLFFILCSVSQESVLEAWSLSTMRQGRAQTTSPHI